MVASCTRASTVGPLSAWLSAAADILNGFQPSALSPASASNVSVGFWPNMSFVDQLVRAKVSMGLELGGLPVALRVNADFWPHLLSIAISGSSAGKTSVTVH